MIMWSGLNSVVKYCQIICRFLSMFIYESMWYKFLITVSELLEVDFVFQSTRIDFKHDISSQVFFIFNCHMLHNGSKCLWYRYFAPSLLVTLHPHISDIMWVFFLRGRLTWVSVAIWFAFPMILHKSAKVFKTDDISEISVHIAKLSVATTVTTAVDLNWFQCASDLLPDYKHGFRITGVTYGPTCYESLVTRICCIVFWLFICTF